MARADRAARMAERRELRSALTEPGPVMEAAAAFLAVRPRSVGETRRRLRHLGYPHRLVDEVVDRLIDMDYLDDESFARSWVESRDRARPRGEGALRRELGLKGVGRETVDLVLSERVDASGGDAADEDGARRLLERRRATLEREPDIRRRRQKAYGLLARNGFDPQVCHEASAAFVQQIVEAD
jgi:regulatory protein